MRAASETSRDISFCGHAILGNEVFIIANALENRRFADSPLVVNHGIVESKSKKHSTIEALLSDGDSLMCKVKKPKNKSQALVTKPVCIRPKRLDRFTAGIAQTI